MTTEVIDNKDSVCNDVLYTINVKEFDESITHLQQAAVNTNYHQQDVNTKPQQLSPNSSAIGNQCLVCNKTFRSSASLIIHLRFHTGERPYSCTRCTKAFCSLSSLTSHLRRHDASTRIYKCTLCPRSFVYPRELIRHTRIHTGARPFVCTVCGKGFAQEGDLVKHNRVHTGERPYQCSDISCGRTFPSASNLRAHMRHVHNADSIERRHICTVCDKKFIMATHLRAHMRTHSCERAHTCTVCGKAFREAGTLRRHMTTHSSDRPYRCSECGKCFPIANNLKKHMRVHTGERPYSCQICQKSFSSGSNLKTHQKSHTGEKLHKCEFCSRLFTLSSHLKAHRKTHNKTQTYHCTLCDKSYSTTASLRRHVAMHKGQSNVLSATPEVQNGDFNHDIGASDQSVVCQMSITDSMASGLLAATTPQMTEMHSKSSWDINEQTQNPLHNSDVMFNCNNKGCVVTSEQCGSIELETRPVQQSSTLNYATLANYPILHTEPGSNETYLYQPYTAHISLEQVQQMNKVPMVFCHGENFNETCQAMGVNEYVCTANTIQHNSVPSSHEIKTLRCSLCDRTFVSEEVLNLHMRSHAADKHFTCSHCSTTFMEESSLRRHIKVHQ